MVKMKKLASHFYCDRSFAGDTAANFILSTPIDKQLYFAHPSSFNDPFDSYPSFDFDATIFA
jgi:hypothetical protein